MRILHEALDELCTDKRMSLFNKDLAPAFAMDYLVKRKGFKKSGPPRYQVVDAQGPGLQNIVQVLERKNGEDEQPTRLELSMDKISGFRAGFNVYRLPTPIPYVGRSDDWWGMGHGIY